MLDYLEQNGLAKNTIVFYTSDNGFFLGDHGLYDKRFMYEPGLRIPLLVRWPPASRREKRTDAFVAQHRLSPDLPGTGRRCRFHPTCRAVRSLPLLRGEKPANWRTSFYYRYYHDPGRSQHAAHYGLRTATHKLIHYWKSDQWECFDLVRDPKELRNLAADKASAELVAGLKQELARLKQEVKDEDQFADKQPAGGVDGQPAPKPAK